MTKKNILHISHSDLDGFGAHIISKYIEGLFPLYFEYINTTSTQLVGVLNSLKLESKLDKYDSIIITDLHVSVELYEFINSLDYKSNFKVIDHHPTVAPIGGDSIYDVRVDSKLFYKAIDESESISKGCGTSHYLEYVYDIENGLLSTVKDINKFSTKVNELKQNVYLTYFVNTVRLYDTYEFKETLTKYTLIKPIENNKFITKGYWFEFEEISNIAFELNLLFKLLGKDEFIKYIMHYINTKSNHSLDSLCTGESNEINGKLDSENYAYIKKLIGFEIDSMNKYIDYKLGNFKQGVISYAGIEYTIAYNSAEQHVSELCNRYLTANSDIDMAMIISDGTINLRSLRVDVSRIAREFKGGGHKHAAGFPIENHIFNKASLENYFKIEAHWKIILK